MITKEKITAFAPALPAFLLLVCGILFLVTDGLPFAGMILKNKKLDIEDLNTSLEYTLSDNKLFRQELSGLQEIHTTAINLPAKDAELLFREQVAGLQIKNIGQVRSTAINERITVFELKFNASGTISEITEFLARAAAGTPRLYWRSLHIEPDSTVSPDHVLLSGTITAFNFDPALQETTQAAEAK